MANTHFVVNLQTGLGTVTLKIFTRGTNTLLNTGGDTAAEDGTRPGFYDFTVSENVTGIQDALLLTAGGVVIASLQTPIHSADDTNTYVIEELSAARLSSGTGTGQLDFTSGVVKSNVTQYGGSNGTFSSGRPEVNTTHWGGTAIASAYVQCDVAKISGDATAADNAESFFDGTGYAGTNNVIPTVTLVNTLTTYTGNTPQTGDSYARIGATGSGLTSLASASALSALSAIFSGITSLAQWLGLMAGKQTGNSTARTELRATGGGSGTFDETTDSLEAIKDAGGGLDAAGVRAAVGLASANLDTQLDALPTNAELATALGTADDATLAAIAGLNNISAADVWAAGTRTLTAGTNIQLPANGLANISAWTVNITGSLSGSVGSISGVTFPSNFAALGINASGHISRVTLADTVTTLTGHTAQTGDSYAYLGTNVGALGANLSAIPKTGFILASNGLSNVTAWTVALTGNITGNLSGSVGSVTAAITLPTIPTDWITANGIATDAFGSLELATPAAQEIATALLDLADGIETGVTLRQAIRFDSAILVGLVSGGGTGTEVFKAIGNSGTTRVTSVNDADGNRTSVTLNG